jgi:hypothetical protein
LADVSESRYKVTVAFVGIFVALMTTGMGVGELIVVSGKLNGFAFIATPLMLATLITGGGAVGRLRAKGREDTAGPLTLFVLKPRLFASNRTNPCWAVNPDLQRFPGPFPT